MYKQTLNNLLGNKVRKTRKNIQHTGNTSSIVPFFDGCCVIRVCFFESEVDQKNIVFFAKQLWHLSVFVYILFFT
ncbi:hypothetical protein FHS10_002508 [Mucilaginibacter dorajii]|nr:hypothetical protein [Mucilaginibacter dorajii]